jgi:hypothetical protein
MQKKLNGSRNDAAANGNARSKLAVVIRSMADFIFWLTVLFGVLGTVVLQFIAKRQAPLDRRELLEERYA